MFLSGAGCINDVTGRNRVCTFSKTWSGILKRRIWFFISLFLNSELSQYDDEERRGKCRQPSLSFFVSVSFTNCLVGGKLLNFIIIVR